MGPLVGLGWIIFVAVVAIWCAIDLSMKYGILGFFLGLVLGVLVGAMSATIWAFVFYFIFRFGRSIYESFKPKSEPQYSQAREAEMVVPVMTKRERISRYFVAIFFFALGVGCACDAATYDGSDAQRSIIAFAICAAFLFFGGLKLIGLFR